MNVTDGQSFLESQGINLFHVFETESIADLLKPAAPHLNLDDYPSAVLIAHAGRQLWESLQKFGMVGNDPVDNYSVHLAHRFSREYLNTEAEILYPSDLPIPLLQIGRRTGWSFPSLVGTSIHPHYGLWFAYRVLFLLKLAIPATEVLPTVHPCEICETKPCKPICPPNAVQEISNFDLAKCGKFRIEENSVCGLRCLARLRCPVGSQYRYEPQQMKYHYNRSLNSILRYFGANNQ